MIIKCDAVLFDMDGTLIDSTLACEQLLRNWATRHNLPMDYVVTYSHGRRNLDVIRDLTPHLAIEEEAARLDEEELNYRDGIIAVRGALQVLCALPGDRWAVVTSASRSVAQMRFACAGLPQPRVLICSKDVNRGKPDPEGYLLAAKRLRVRPEHCLVIEDTPAGLEAGCKSGMPVLGITTTFGPDVLNCDTIADFTAITVNVEEDLSLRLEVGVNCP